MKIEDIEREYENMVNPHDSSNDDDDDDTTVNGDEEGWDQDAIMAQYLAEKYVEAIANDPEKYIETVAADENEDTEETETETEYDQPEGMCSTVMTLIGLGSYPSARRSTAKTPTAKSSGTGYLFDNPELQAWQEAAEARLNEQRKKEEMEEKINDMFAVYIDFSGGYSAVQKDAVLKNEIGILEDARAREMKPVLILAVMGRIIRVLNKDAASLSPEEVKDVCLSIANLLPNMTAVEGPAAGAAAEAYRKIMEQQRLQYKSGKEIDVDSCIEGKSTVVDSPPCDNSLMRIAYLAIKEAIGIGFLPEDEVLCGTISNMIHQLSDKIARLDHRLQANAIRLLPHLANAYTKASSIANHHDEFPSELLQKIKSSISSALDMANDDNPAGHVLGSAALVSSYHLAEKFPFLAEKSVPQIKTLARCEHTYGPMMQFHALCMLSSMQKGNYGGKKIKGLIFDLISSATTPMQSPLSNVVLIRQAERALLEDGPKPEEDRKICELFLIAKLKHSSEMVVYEAARALCHLGGIPGALTESTGMMAAAVESLQGMTTPEDKGKKRKIKPAVDLACNNLLQLVGLRLLESLNANGSVNSGRRAGRGGDSPEIASTKSETPLHMQIEF